MKKKLILILLISTTNLFSQYSNEFNTEKESFQTLSKPNILSDLSLYLKENLSPKDLRKIDHYNIKSSMSKADKKEYDYNIRLSFYINKKNKSWFAKTKTGNKELDKKITNLFYKFPIDKIIKTTNKNRSVKYIVQLFSRQDNKDIINASQYAISETMPSIYNCKKDKFELFKNSCFYNSLRTYLHQNFSKELKTK